jgi:hypothetical protein
MPKELQPEVSQLLDEVRQFVRQGKQEQAYQSSLRATNLAPDEPLAWYLRSQVAPSSEEQLMCLSRSYSLDTAHPDTQKELRTAVQALLKQEPFLAYVHETEQFYQVRSGRDMLINIPKNRVFEKPYLQKPPGLARPAFLWLSISLLALILGGVGALLLTPITALQALRLQSRSQSRSDRIRLWVAFLLSMLVCVAAIPISWLLLIRLQP